MMFMGNDFPIENVIQDVHQLMAERFETEGVPVKKGLVELLHYLKIIIIKQSLLLQVIVIV